MNSLIHHPDWTLPDYQGGSILNLAASLAGHFGVEVGHPGLRTPVSLSGVETVVLFVADGLGQWQLEKHLAEGNLPQIQALLPDAQRQTLTSVFPSTTMAAVTSLHTATSPAQSGWLGYLLWLEEAGAVVEMIGQINQDTQRPIEDRDFLAAVSGVYNRFVDAGVFVAAVQPQAYKTSWLNQWYWRGATQYGYLTTNIIPSVTALPLGRAGPKMVVVYWADYDTVCHRYGPSSREAADEVSALDNAVGRLVRSLARDGKTAFLFTADHGQIDLEPEKTVYLERDAWLVPRLRGAPAGDRVSRTFRVKPSHLEEVAEYLTQYGDVLSSSEAWEAGLFGGAPSNAAFRSRVGDVIALPRNGTQLCWTFSDKQPSRPQLGSHGGLSHQEMLVPLLSVRL